MTIKFSFSPKPVKRRRKAKRFNRSKSLPSMENNKKRNIRSFRDPYICSLKGPILFTAPHSISVVRKISHDPNNETYKSSKKTIHKNDVESTEIHHMERMTAEIALKLSVRVSEILKVSPSFMIWNLFNGFKEDNLDPNYTRSQWFEQSPWHRALHQFKNANPNQPLLHIDLHGRMNRVGDINLDIGYKAMEKCWNNKNTEEFLEQMKIFWKSKMNCVLKGLGCEYIVKKDASKTKIGMRVELDPIYEGFRGHGCDGHTMVHQSVLIGGIIALQFELPFFLRKELMNNDEFFGQFAQCIADFYKDIVIKAYDEKGFDLFNEDVIGKNVNECNGGSKEICSINTKTRLVTNECLNIADTNILLKRIMAISKMNMMRCKGKEWLRRQRFLKKRSSSC